MINIAIINTKVKKVLVQKIRNIKKNKKFGILNTNHVYTLIYNKFIN